MNKPIKIQKKDDGIRIVWDDESVSFISGLVLRRNCPAADSKIKAGDLSHFSPLTPKKISLNIVEQELDVQIKIKKISLVGNYAIGITWADGHNSGIYSFDYLKGLELIEHS